MIDEQSFEEKFPSLEKTKTVLEFIQESLSKIPEAKFIEVSKKGYNLIMKEGKQIGICCRNPKTIYGVEFEIREVLGVGLFHLNYEKEKINNPLYVIYKEKFIPQKTTREGFVNGDKETQKIQDQNYTLAKKNFVDCVFMRNYNKENRAPPTFSRNQVQKHCLDKQKVTDVMTEYWDLLINSGNIEMAGAVAVLKSKLGLD